MLGTSWLFQMNDLGDDGFFGTITICKMNRKSNGSSSPFALWAIVETSKFDKGPLLDSKSTIPHHVLGERNFS